MEQLQGNDALFIAMERAAAPMHVGTVTIYDPSTAPNGFVRFKDILSFTEDRLHLCKTLRQRLIKVPFNIDFPYWIEDDRFDLEYHVRHIALPEPGDWRQLCILASRIFARPLDLSRPPWEMTVIGGVDSVKGMPKGSYAILTKFHHAAIDGVSGVEIMQALHTLTPDVAPPTKVSEWQPETKPSDLVLFSKGYRRALTRPLRQANAFRKALPGIRKAAKGIQNRVAVRPQDKRTPKTRFNGTISPHRVFDARSFDLDKIKSLRALSPGSKINDIMLSITSGALRHYLKAHNELPESSLKTIIPVNIRTDEEAHEIGNIISAMMASLGTDIADVTERLQFIHTQTQTAKAKTSDLGPREVTNIVKEIPLSVLGATVGVHGKLKLADHTPKTVNTVITNVPGPPVPLYMAGAKAMAMFGQICVVDGVGLGHVVISYLGKISICFTADRSALPDPELYSKCIEKSFSEHMKALKALPGDASKTNEKKTEK